VKEQEARVEKHQSDLPRQHGPGLAQLAPGEVLRQAQQFSRRRRQVEQVREALNSPIAGQTALFLDLCQDTILLIMIGVNRLISGLASMMSDRHLLPHTRL
jgi:hypothetical protein